MEIIKHDRNIVEKTWIKLPSHGLYNNAGKDYLDPKYYNALKKAIIEYQFNNSSLK